MPELPEVETTRRGIAPALLGEPVTEVVVRNRSLRYPVSPALMRDLPGNKIERVERRGKYLLLITAIGSVIIHLGMSGSLRLVVAGTSPNKHDHVDIVLKNGLILRFRDPRRFGLVIWSREEALDHSLLRSLGPEPLSAEFDGDYLYQRSRSRRSAVKVFIMGSHLVVGVGNIYASEALFMAGIHPQRAAGRISLARYQTLAAAIKAVLTAAIAEGGTTLRDFVDGSGQPGYFQQKLQVYGRQGEACVECGAKIKSMRLGQRASCYCPRCQR